MYCSAHGTTYYVSCRECDKLARLGNEYYGPRQRATFYVPDRKSPLEPRDYLPKFSPITLPEPYRGPGAYNWF